MAAVCCSSSFTRPFSVACSTSSPAEKETSKPRDDWRKRSKPIRPGGVYPAKDHCSRCGLCDTYYIAHVKDACAFLGDGMSRIEVIGFHLFSSTALNDLRISSSLLGINILGLFPHFG
ncbi:unnamed protein product [Musa textilis]